MMNDIQTVFKNFQGNWSFDREMHSRKDGELQATAKGEASFLLGASDHELLYHEAGYAIYYPEETKIDCFRDYSYRLYNDQLEIYHVGGQQHNQLYQSYELDDKSSNLNHIKIHFCGKDQYEGSYQLIDDDHFVLTTIISPIPNENKIENQNNMHNNEETYPSKDSIIKTRFQRLNN